jgi:MFS family permease
VTARIGQAAYETIAALATEPMPPTEQHQAPEDTVVEEDIPSQGTPEQTRLAASAMHRRERQAYGGTIQWEAAFFGWLVATGLAAILVAMAVGAGVALGLTEIDDPARTQAERLTFAGGAALIGILMIAYLAGGYVAGRMARFDGWRQGLGVWIVAVVMTVALAATAWIAGGEVNPLESLELPRIPVDEEAGLSGGGAIALAVAAVVALLAAVVGGRGGERFHRAVDEAGEELPVPEAAQES